MADSKRKAPKLRFPGFNDDWEQRKLGDYLTVPQKIKMNVTSREELMTVKLNLGGIQSGSTRETLELGSTTYYKRKAGQFIYGKQNFFNGSMAIIPSELDGKATSGDVPALDIHGISPEYLLTYVSRKEFWKRKESAASGTGSKRIHENILQGFEINVPLESEQKKISSFFKQLDDLITLHQRKLSDVQKLKSGLLQKMFPKNGEKVPEIRFPEFSDDWEQRKLKELGKTQSGIGFPDNEQGGEHGIPFYKVSDMNNIGNEIEMTNSNNYVSVEQISRKKWKPIEAVPAVIFAKVGAAIMLNRKRIVNSPFLIDNNTMAYIFDKSWDTNFGKVLFETINLPKYAQVGALPSYNSSDIEAIEIKVPDKVEQQQIGLFFKQLDDLITLHQRKLEHLQQQKKALLQQMFI